MGARRALFGHKAVLRRRGKQLIGEDHHLADMDDLSRLAERPLAFIFRYVARRPLAHGAILLAVVGAAGCAVSTQYGVKFMVDTLAKGQGSNDIWLAFTLLVALMAADNFLWRVAGWIASYAFVGVSGDLRGELFRHLTGHAPSFFAERRVGALTGRVTATSNAVFTVQNMFIWNVLPPCIATTGRGDLPVAGRSGDDRLPGRGRGRAALRPVPAGRRGQDPAHGLRRQGGRRRGRADRRRHQHAAGAYLRCDRA